MMEFLDITFGYFTPETTLPLASALAAVLGFGLLLVRAPIRIAGRWVRGLAKRIRRTIDRFGV